MTALADLLVQGECEFANCLHCDGEGFLTRPEFAGRGINRVQVGEDHLECLTCQGTGLVPADSVSTCDCCTGRFWTGNGCEHGVDVLCAECVRRCTDCVDEVRAEMAETDRVLVRMGFAG